MPDQRPTLTELAAQLESAEYNRREAAHDAEFARRERAQEEAAFLSDPDYRRASADRLVATPLGEKLAAEPETPEWGAAADPARVLSALENGGRAVVTVRSHRTGRHVTITLTVRKQKPGGQGWISRATIAGRVGIHEGDVIEVRDPELDYTNNYVGRFYLDNQTWRAGRGADGARVYAAERVIDYALAGTAMSSEVFLASQCSYCGHTLTDPESIERGIGPECYGRHTSSRMHRHGAVS